MGGPIVRTGTTPKFWKNWDNIFGDDNAKKQTKKKSTAKATKKSSKKKAAKSTKKKATK